MGQIFIVMIIFYSILLVNAGKITHLEEEDKEEGSGLNEETEETTILGEDITFPQLKLKNLTSTSSPHAMKTSPITTTTTTAPTTTAPTTTTSMAFIPSEKMISLTTSEMFFIIGVFVIPVVALVIVAIISIILACGLCLVRPREEISMEEKKVKDNKNKILRGYEKNRMLRAQNVSPNFSDLPAPLTSMEEANL